MRTALFLALLMLAAPACRQHRYFVDMDRAVNETDEGKKAAAEIGREFESKRREFAEADTAAKKAEDAKEADAAAKRARATETGQRLQREMDFLRDGSKIKLVTGVKLVLLHLADERGVDAIDLSSSVAWVDPSSDLTAEVIKRINANSGKTELDELRAKVTALEKKGKP